MQASCVTETYCIIILPALTGFLTCSLVTTIVLYPVRVLWFLICCGHPQEVQVSKLPIPGPVPQYATTSKGHT